MEKYIITDEYADGIEDLLASGGFAVGDIVTQDDDYRLHLAQNDAKGTHTNGDPVLPPPHKPPTIP